MKKIATPTAVNGEFVDGNRETGRKATQFSAEWCNDIQNEIWNLIRGLKGSDPTGESQDETLKAVNRHIVEYLTQENLTSAKIFDVLEAGKLPVLQIGGGGASGYTKMYAYPCTFEKTNDGYRRAVFFRLARGEVNNVVSNVLYWYEYVNIPTDNQGEGSSNGSFNIDSPELKSLGVVGNAEVGGNIVAGGTLRGSSVLAEDGGEFAVIDNGGHPVGKARTKWKPDVIANGNIASDGFLIVEGQTADDYYEGREFVVFNSSSSDINVRIYMVEWDSSTSKFKFITDTSSAGVNGHKIMNVTVRRGTSRVIVYAGVYDSDHGNEGGFFAVE